MASSPTITNCTISGNTAGYPGGGIHCASSSPTITNCIIDGNSASYEGGGIYCDYRSTPALIDCILWGDSPDEVYTCYSSYPTLNYCDIQGGWFGVGSKNIDEDPLFVSGPLHNYYLSQVAAGQSADSPCVNAGSDTAENINLDGLSTRTNGAGDTGIVDMGYHAPYALWIDSITRTGDNTMIHWNALPGVSYLMEFSTDLDNWTSIPAHETDTWIDTNSGGYSNRYYRVREVE